jgi:hypothetical protein
MRGGRSHENLGIGGLGEAEVRTAPTFTEQIRLPAVPLFLTPTESTSEPAFRWR